MRPTSRTDQQREAGLAADALAKGAVGLRSRNVTSKLFAISLVVAACWAALGAAPGFAKGMREFAGFYRILQATNQDGRVEVRISLRVFNYREADVQDPTISLASLLPHPPGAGEA